MITMNINYFIVVKSRTEGRAIHIIFSAETRERGERERGGERERDRGRHYDVCISQPSHRDVIIF